MTFEELKAALAEMSDEQLQRTVLFHDGVDGVTVELTITLNGRPMFVTELED